MINLKFFEKINQASTDKTTTEGDNITGLTVNGLSKYAIKTNGLGIDVKLPCVLRVSGSTEIYAFKPLFENDRSIMVMYNSTDKTLERQPSSIVTYDIVSTGVTTQLLVSGSTSVRKVTEDIGGVEQLQRTVVGSSSPYSYSFDEEGKHTFEFTSQKGNYSTPIFKALKTITDVELIGMKSVTNTSFQNCSALTSVTLGDVTSLGQYSFSGCTSLSHVDMPNVISVNDRAFSGCTSLTSVTMDNAVVIGYRAFHGCTNLTGEYTLEKCTNISALSFSGTKITKMTLPVCTVFGYSTDTGTFMSCKGITEVIAPNLIKIGKNCFSGSSVKSVNYPLATTICDGAFYQCYSLTSVTLNSITTIPRQCFEYDSAIKTFIAPEVTTIGYSGMTGCSQIKELNFPKLKTIQDGGGLAGMNSLTSINMPNVVSIGIGGFSSRVTKLDIPLCQTLKTYSLRYNNYLTTLNINTCATIGDYAFSGDTRLTTIDISDVTTVTTLSNVNAFTGVPSSCRLIIPDALYTTEDNLDSDGNVIDENIKGGEWFEATNWASLYENNKLQFIAKSKNLI